MAHKTYSTTSRAHSHDGRGRNVPDKQSVQAIYSDAAEATSKTVTHAQEKKRGTPKRLGRRCRACISASQRRVSHPSKHKAVAQTQTRLLSLRARELLSVMSQRRAKGSYFQRKFRLHRPTRIRGQRQSDGETKIFHKQRTSCR